MDRAYFEALYNTDPDPWKFATSDYEHQKYQATLAALARPAYGRAIEIGCSIGILTARLAARCDRLEAIDISPTALEKARDNCRACENINFRVAAAPDGLPEGPFDLIVLSEVLYYLDEHDVARLGSWCLANAGAGAHLVLCHWLGVTDYPLAGLEAGAIFLKAMQPRLDNHVVLHQDVYRLERIGLRP